MILRYWSASLPAKNLPAYRGHLERSVFPELKSIPGFIRAECLTRPFTNDALEVVVLTVWQSLESIDAFAGPDPEAAVVAPAAAALFTSYDRRVRHYEVTSSI